MRLPRLSRTRAVIVLAVLVVGYFIFTAVGDALLSRELNRDEARIGQQIAELQHRQQRLLAVRDYLLSDEYVEGVARRTLGWVRPGESLIIVSSSITPTPTPAGEAALPDTRPWWEQLYGP